MPFVKLDTGILDSTLWIEKDQRDVFLTALLMAEPREFAEPIPQIEVDSMAMTGFVAPPGWYGFCPAAGAGIIRRSLTEHFAGMSALRALGSPDVESRSKEFEGRRLIRVNGGYVVLNFMAYRDRDYGAAERMRRLRARRKEEKAESVLPNGDAVPQNVTQAEDRGQIAEAEAEAKEQEQPPLEARAFGRSPRPTSDGIRVNPESGGELIAANHLLEELGVVADNGVRRVAADAIRLLAKEGGDVQTATTFILEAGRAALGDGELINRFWFTDQRYRPRAPTKTKSQKTQEKVWADFNERNRNLDEE